MAQTSGPRLFSTRNILGAVLVAGIAAGIYLSDFLKGPGLGGGGANQPQKNSESPKVQQTQSESDTDQKPAAAPDKSSPVASTDVVKILIDNRSFLLRTSEGDSPAELNDVISQVKSTSGDADGIRVRVYRKATSRASTEIALRDALMAAGVTEEQIVWVPNVVD